MSSSIASSTDTKKTIFLSEPVPCQVVCGTGWVHFSLTEGEIGDYVDDELHEVLELAGERLERECGVWIQGADNILSDLEHDSCSLPLLDEQPNMVLEVSGEEPRYVRVTAVDGSPVDPDGDQPSWCWVKTRSEVLLESEPTLVISNGFLESDSDRVHKEFRLTPWSKQ